MTKIPPPDARTIRNAFDVVRERMLPLLHRWRFRRAGTEAQQRFESLAATLAANPDGGPEVIEATRALGALLESKAPSASAAVDPAIDALIELHAALTNEMPLIQTNLADLTLDERAEYMQVMADEAKRQAAGLPPSDADGHHCAICALLERQRLRRAS